MIAKIFEFVVDICTCATSQDAFIIMMIIKSDM